MNNKNIEAFLFDYDGTLADSMQDNYNAWRKAFLNFNVNIKEGDYFLLEGMKVQEVARTICRVYALDESIINRLVELKNEYYLRESKFKLYEGVEELISYLKKENKKIALVTASPRKKIQKTMPKNFLEKFDVIVSGDDVKEGKPHPESYLIALQKLNINKEKAIVVENAPLGIQSAKNAGIYCIAVCSTLDKSKLMMADKIIDNIKDILNNYQ